MNNREWIPYQEIDFADPTLLTFHVDTRDFHCIANGNDDSAEFRLEKLYKTKWSKFFHTPKEVRELLDRYYTESGGAGEWRMFSLQGAKSYSGWDLKYIRIYRTKYGLLVCGRKHDCMNKETLALPVDKQALHGY